MATGIENTAQMVIDHPQSNINVQGGTRTYREVLTDPKASPAIKYELIQQFQKELLNLLPQKVLRLRRFLQQKLNYKVVLFLLNLIYKQENI